MRQINYPKTPQFKSINMQIKHDTRFMGVDEQGQPIYDKYKGLPTLEFKGTVKLHGTNAAISYDGENIWYQSRNNIVTDGHFGFPLAMNELNLLPLFDGLDTSDSIATIYGEWAGEGIQEGVAVSKLPKTFYIFGYKISPKIPDDFHSYWVDVDDFQFVSDYENIKNINEFPVYSVEVDFNNPEEGFNKMVELTQEVEEECPVAFKLGVSGIGEGIVWTHNVIGDDSPRYIFKTKGNKHSNSKVKVARSIDLEQINSCKEFASNHVTENRVKQALFENNIKLEEATKQYTGVIVKWTTSDIMKEEQLSIKNSNLNTKLLPKEIGNLARNLYFKMIEI